MRKIWAFVLCMAITVLYIPHVHALGADYELSYSINPDGKTVTVTGFEVEPTEEYDLLIPRKVVIDGTTYLVTDIANGEVDSNSIYRSIFGGTRASGVTAYNTLLRSVSLPNTLKTIGDGAFAVCKKLTEIEIPYGVTRIGAQAFRFCENVKTLGAIPDTVTEIGRAAFGGLTNLGGLITIPGKADLKEAKTFESAVRGGSYGYMVLNEGLSNLSSSFSYSCNWLQDMVFPSTLVKTDITPFVGNNMNRLANVYILSDNFSWAGGGTIATGSANTAPTQWYVVNETVKSVLTDRGVLPEQVTVINDNIIVFNEMFENYPIQYVNASGSVELYTPVKEGYNFKYWTDGINNYKAGETYTPAHSVVLNAVWQKADEADTVLYKTVTGYSDTADFEPMPVRRIYCPELKDTVTDIVLKDASGYEETFKAEFGSDGMWVNYCNNDEYVSVALPKGEYSEIRIFTEAEDGYSVVLGLREPAVICSPRINKVSDSEAFSWKSSDVTVAKVENGIVTGCKSGEAVISVSLDGVTFEINVTVKGELALAEEEGKQSEYIAAKKPVIDALNAAIAAKDKAAFAAILTGSGPVKLSEIKDIDTSEFETAKPEFLEEMAERIFTYGSIPFTQLSDVDALSGILSAEFELGKLNHLTSSEAVLEVIDKYNDYYRLPVDNKYYIRYKDKVLNRFINYTAVNRKSTKADFTEAYVLAAVNEAPNYGALAEVIQSCETEIGYSLEAYSKHNNSGFHKALMEKRASITTIDALKEYIDSYTPPAVPPSSGKVTGGGGGGYSSPAPSAGTSTVPVGNTTDKSIVQRDTEPLFTDVANDRWSYDSIAYLVAKKVIDGYADGGFYPENNISRAEFIKIAVSAFGLGNSEAEEPETEENTEETENTPKIKFNDVNENDWYCSWVTKAAEAGIIKGGTDGNFYPNALITRQEAAAILYRIITMKNITVPLAGTAVLSDNADIDEWAYTPVMRLVQMQIITGMEDGTFRPRDNATREQAAKITAQLLKYANGDIKISYNSKEGEDNK